MHIPLPVRLAQEVAVAPFLPPFTTAEAASAHFNRSDAWILTVPQFIHEILKLQQQQTTDICPQQTTREMTQLEQVMQLRPRNRCLTRFMRDIN